MREHQRSLNKAQRELDRERTKLEVQEKKLVVDIKKAARNNQMVSSPFHWLVCMSSLVMSVWFLSVHLHLFVVQWYASDNTPLHSVSLSCIACPRILRRDITLDTSCRDLSPLTSIWIS